MTTAKQIIEHAAGLDGVHELWGKQYDRGLFALNLMLNDWSNERVNIYKTVRESVTLTYDDNEYSIGSGGDFNTAWPVRIISAFIVRSGVSFPIHVGMSNEQYAMVGLKSQRQRVSNLLYEPSYPLGKIIVTPVPNASDTMYLYSHKPLDQFASLAATSVLPPPYELAVAYNLAVDLAPAFERDPRPSVYQRAAETKKALQRANRTVAPINTDAVSGAGVSYDSSNDLFDLSSQGEVFPYVFPFSFT